MTASSASERRRGVPGRSRSRPAAVGLQRSLAAVIAAGACGAGLFLAAHHPLAPKVAVGAFALACALASRDRTRWLLLVPGVLPVLSFAPWTGWLTFEEIDLLLLAVIAGGQARRAWSTAQPGRTSRPTADPSGPVRLAVAVFVACTAASLLRGVADAGGFVFGWYQGYHEPMNSLRIAKGPLLAVLLWPLWLDAARAEPELAAARLRTGLLLGLGAASLAAVWERVAFPGLLDFSSDYRTTALFWEMHVGGAALDGFLALTLPFALLGLLTPVRRGGAVLAAAVLALGAYACLTTFSRGVYAAIPVGLAVFGALRLAANPGAPAHRAELAVGAGLVAAFTVAVVWTFPGSGYRGAVALLFASAAVVGLAGLPATLTLRDRLIGLACGVLFAGLGVALEAAVVKGAYAASAAAALLVGVSWGWLRRSRGVSITAAVGLVAGAVWSLVAWVRVGERWGGAEALSRALPVAAALGALLLTAVFAGAARASRRPPWPARPRWQAATLGSMVLAAGIAAVFAGGAYMSDRFSTSGGDFEVRRQHWREGAALLTTPGDWWLGRGLGRYPAADYIARLGAEHPGDYRLESTDAAAGGAAPHLVLAAGQQVLGFGEVLRISQRVTAPGALPTVRVALRVARPVELALEVCEKQLLYNAGCQMRALEVRPEPSGWRTVETRLEGGPVSRGHWWAPRQLVFSIALGTPGATAEIAGVELIGATGEELLANGDFSDGLAHWFFSSDRYHLPWHIKNMALDLLLDQGAVGLAVVAALVAAALWRLAFGAARRHPLAPALAAGLVGFLVVGLFDSLLDVPRDALLFYLLTFVALGLPGTDKLTPR